MKKYSPLRALLTRQTYSAITRLGHAPLSTPCVFDRRECLSWAIHMCPCSQDIRNIPSVRVLWRNWHSNYSMHIASENLLQCGTYSLSAGESGHSWPWQWAATITCGCSHLSMPVLAHTAAEHRSGEKFTTCTCLYSFCKCLQHGCAPR